MKCITNHRILNLQTQTEHFILFFSSGLESIKVWHNGRENKSKGQVINGSFKLHEMCPKEICGN